jgi:diguanylate cyclase (GGDEF)-like protein
MAPSESDAGKSKEVHFLYTEIAKLITSSLEVTEVIDAIMNEVKLYFQPQNWSLLRLDQTTKKLFFVVSDGINKDLLKNIHLNLGEGIAGHVAKFGKSRIVTDASGDAHFSPIIDNLTGFKTLSIIAVPIKFQNQVLGVIELINTLESRPFSDEDLEILEVIADFAAIALTNAMRYEYMSSLAVSDPLTGLYNRARLDKLIKSADETGLSPEEQTRAACDSRIIVACVDVDNLKAINDSYGHRAGDEVLIKTARRIQLCCKDTDFAFRIGGDEFLIVIMNVDKNYESVLIGCLQKELDIHSKPIKPGFGFSYGIVAGTKKSLKNLIVEADKQMYKNKSRIDDKNI